VAFAADIVVDFSNTVLYFKTEKKG
jgi:hypothetical protein